MTGAVQDAERSRRVSIRGEKQKLKVVGIRIRQAVEKQFLSPTGLGLSLGLGLGLTAERGKCENSHYWIHFRPAERELTPQYRQKGND